MTSYFQRFGRATGSHTAKTAPPVLGSAVRFPYGAFQFKARIPKGAAFEIQASNDVKTWRVIVEDTSPLVGVAESFWIAKSSPDNWTVEIPSAS
ncbi:MAG: hypothetical protein JWR69_4524 [Pedosphaera sp.]|nr:hypothetical protein [Pedosphaera sp.]